MEERVVMHVSFTLKFYAPSVGRGCGVDLARKWSIVY
jgi:hypothetical protein